VLQFQTSPSLLDTPLEALAGIDADGRVLWLNGVAQRLTGCSVQGRPEVDEVFGLSLDGLLALHRQQQAHTLRLPNGLGVWIKGHLNASDGADFNHSVALSAPAAPLATEPVAKPVPNEAPGRLVDHSQRLIETTLADCDGNIAKAARALGVSRGMLYRRLQKNSLRAAEGTDPTRPPTVC